jgi:hypothetical protein
MINTLVKCIEGNKCLLSVLPTSPVKITEESDHQATEKNVNEMEQH